MQRADGRYNYAGPIVDGPWRGKSYQCSAPYFRCVETFPITWRPLPQYGDYIEHFYVWSYSLEAWTLRC